MQTQEDDPRRRPSPKNMASTIDDATNAALFHEVKALIDGADEDEKHALSSDDEDYAERVIGGATSRSTATRSTLSRLSPASSSTSTHATRKESVAAIGNASFHARMDAVFGGLIAGEVAPTAMHGLQCIGPAFSNQCQGHNLAEPLAASLAPPGLDNDGDDVDDGVDGSFDGRQAVGGDDDDGMDSEGEERGDDDDDEGDVDPREWSRHTATWATDLSDSDEEQGSRGDCTRGAVPASAARNAIAAFGGLDDLDDLEADGPGDHSNGNSRPGMAQEGGAPREVRAQQPPASILRKRPEASAGLAATAAPMRDPKRVRFEPRQQEPQGGQALEQQQMQQMHHHQQEQTEHRRSGYKYYSLDGVEGDTDEANARGLAQLLQLVGSAHAAPPRAGASSHRPPSARQARVGHAMPECVVGAARGTAYHQQARASKHSPKSSSGLHSAAVPASLPARSRVALSHLVDDDEGDDQEGVANDQMEL